MFVRTATLPLRARRKLARALAGGGRPPPPPRPADAWELRQARAARGLEPGPTATGDAPPRASAAGRDRGHDHDHDHDHDHGHDHGHQHASGAPPIQVRVAQTPNPAARKFTLDRALGAPTSRAFQSPAEAASDPLAASLFRLSGVRSVFAVDDFITVTAEAEADWSRLSPAVVAVLQEQAG